MMTRSKSSSFDFALALQVGQYAHQVAAHRAADAAVVHLDDLLVGLGHQQFVVDPGRAELIFDHGDPVAVLFRQDAVEQRGLSRTEKARQHRHRDLRFALIHVSDSRRPRHRPLRDARPDPGGYPQAFTCRHCRLRQRGRPQKEGRKCRGSSAAARKGVARPHRPVSRPAPDAAPSGTRTPARSSSADGRRRRPAVRPSRRRRRRRSRPRPRFSGTGRRRWRPEQENVSIEPPGASRRSALRLMSL